MSQISSLLPKIGIKTVSVVTDDTTLDVNKGYIANKAGLVTFTLPATASIGDVIEITGINTGFGWKISQNANQAINIVNVQSTVGVLGSVSSSEIYDSIRLMCTVGGTSTRWNALSLTGNLTIL